MGSPEFRRRRIRERQNGNRKTEEDEEELRDAKGDKKTRSGRRKERWGTWNLEEEGEYVRGKTKSRETQEGK